LQLDLVRRQDRVKEKPPDRHGRRSASSPPKASTGSLTVAVANSGLIHSSVQFINPFPQFFYHISYPPYFVTFALEVVDFRHYSFHSRNFGIRILNHVASPVVAGLYRTLSSFLQL
jgi:hypothetical protein